MRQLTLSWNGQDYQCQITHRLIMQIEDQVILSQLGARLTDPSTNGHTPTSHVAWVFFCLLRSVGVPVSQDDVWKSVCEEPQKHRETLTTIMAFIFAEVFGTGPKDPEGIREEKKSPEPASADMT